MRGVLLALCWLLSLAWAAGAPAQARPPVPVDPVHPTATRHLSRTAHLLLSGTPAAPQQIRILVYGQSISQQDWWKMVREHLERTYPNTRITMLNRAIGGFSAERLKHMVADDVVPFQPDLILFHDYGNEQDYEEIIRLLRSHTTAEIAVQNDHFSPHQNNVWHNRHSWEWLPALAEKYGLALIDVRGAWQRYLKTAGVHPDSLLRDHVHLNGHGNHVMAEIVKRHLTFPRSPGVPANHPVRDYRVGRDLRFANGRATLPFNGNRVDLVWSPRATENAEIDVRIDGKPVSEFLGCWYHTRPGETLGGKSWPPRMGMPVSVDLGGQPREETWTLTVTRADSLARTVEFDLTGSRTGPDGSGSSVAPFRSNSGTISIRPEQWFVRKNPGDFSFLPIVRAGDRIEWSVRSMCHDRLKRTDGVESVTVAQGLPNTQHTLELIVRNGSAPVRAVRVFRPPLAP